MNKADLDLFRQWIQAEIDAKIAAREPGSDGHFCTAHAENAEADRLYSDLVDQLTLPDLGDYFKASRAS